MPSIALGTVYRNLGIMADCGEIRRIVCDGSPDKYDRAFPFHDHLICSVCGKTADINVGDLKPEIERKTGMKIGSYELRVKYICDNCKKR